jgi:hypothetical protein
MSREVGLSEYSHEFVQCHGLEAFAIKFKPVDEADIVKTIKCTFDDGDVFVIGVTFTSTLQVDTRLWARITRAHIWGFNR